MSKKQFREGFMMNFVKFIFIVSLATLLFGCAKTESYFFAKKAPEKEHNVSLISKKLQKRHVEVYEYGQSATLLLSSQYFFVERSANFTENAYEALELILAFSSYYKESSLVTVVGYRNSMYGNRIARALAIERARRIVQYLWSSGMDVTFAYADGKNMILNKSKKHLNDCVIIEFLYGL